VLRFREDFFGLLFWKESWHSKPDLESRGCEPAGVGAHCVRQRSEGIGFIRHSRPVRVIPVKAGIQMHSPLGVLRNKVVLRHVPGCRVKARHDKGMVTRCSVKARHDEGDGEVVVIDSCVTVSRRFLWLLSWKDS